MRRAASSSLKWLSGALLTLFATLVLGLPSDREQPIHISADKALRDEKKGITVYQGNVEMNQGSLHIEAEKITIHHQAEQADRIIAQGTPARMQQKPAPDKEPVQAHAEIIEYHQAEDRLRLITDAQIVQDGSTVTGDSIDYFISEELVRADSDQQKADSRVEVIIPAKAVNKKETDTSATTDSE